MAGRVAVIGAGIVGLSVGAELAELGADTTVVEAEHPAAGVTGGSFAWINSHRKLPDSYHELNARAVRFWHEDLVAVQPEGFHPSGHLVVASDEGHRSLLLERRDRLVSLDYPVRELSAAEAHELEPSLDLAAIAAPDACFMHFPVEGYVVIQPVIASLLERLRAAGGALVTAGVDRIESLGASGALLHEGAESHRFDAVFVCAGLATGRLLATGGWHVPLVPPVSAGPSLGFLARARTSAPSALNGVVTTDLLSAHGDGEHELMLQALDLDRHTDAASAAMPEHVRALIRARLAAMIPGEAGAAVTGFRSERVMPADGVPVVGPVNPEGTVWTLVTHSGVTLGPWLARCAARAYAAGEEDRALGLYSPARFAGRQDFAALPAPRRPGEQ